ncbi:hypothetical protein ACS0TY_003517 [Phlomoides rotata]
MNLFGILLISSSKNSLENIFEKTWECMSDDILSRQRCLLNFPDLQLSDEQLKNYVEIEKILQMNESSLSRFASMSIPYDALMSEGHNRLMQEECHFDRA